MSIPLLLDERRGAWIGKSLLLRGTLIASEDLVVDGTIEGAIDVGDHALTVGVGAIVKADLVATSITIHGTVVGDVTARERLDLRATASVDGNVRAPRLAMEDGAELRGTVE